MDRQTPRVRRDWWKNEDIRDESDSGSDDGREEGCLEGVGRPGLVRSAVEETIQDSVDPPRSVWCSTRSSGPNWRQRRAQNEVTSPGKGLVTYYLSNPNSRSGIFFGSACTYFRCKTSVGGWVFYVTPSVEILKVKSLLFWLYFYPIPYTGPLCKRFTA